MLIFTKHYHYLTVIDLQLGEFGNRVPNLSLKISGHKLEFPMVQYSGIREGARGVIYTYSASIIYGLNFDPLSASEIYLDNHRLFECGFLSIAFDKEFISLETRAVA